MKRKGKNIEMHLDDNSRFGAMHDILERRRQSRRSTVNAQEYTDDLRGAYKSYTSAMQKIKENLETATQGLAAIDEKGMSDKVIEAVEAITEIRQKQIEATSEYSTQLASFDSKRVDYIRKNGDSRDRFVVEQFEKNTRQQNAKLRAEIDELDRRRQDIETDLYRDENGKHKDPTDEEMLSAKRSIDGLLEKKQQAMARYAEFLQQSAVQRDEILNGWQDSENQESVKDQEAPEETKAKAKKIETAFETAQEEKGSRWEKFKSLPVIAQLGAGAAVIGRKISPKFENAKSDFVAAYAIMKERRQVRKIERELSSLDELQGRTGDRSFLSKFKESLNRNSEEADYEETAEPERTESYADIMANTTQSGDTEPDAGAPNAEEEQSVPDTGDAETKADPDAEPDKPVPLSQEEIHNTRVRKAGNTAILKALDDTGLRKMINDYYWSDVSETHDIVADLQSSDDMIKDLTQYVERIKNMIGHWPNKTYREAMSHKLDKAMTQTYQAKMTSEKEVEQAESRIRDSEEFLRNLYEPGASETELTGPNV